jgi:hypothetical protein
MNVKGSGPSSSVRPGARTRIAAVAVATLGLVTAGCSDKAKPSYAECVILEAKGDIKGAAARLTRRARRGRRRPRRSPNWLLRQPSVLAVQHRRRRQLHRRNGVCSPLRSRGRRPGC